MRRRIAAAPNGNSSGKSSRFKGHAIVCALAPMSFYFRLPPVSLASHRASPPFLSLVPLLTLSLWPCHHACPSLLDQSLRYLRHKNTMTPPISTGIQVLCFLYIDPPYECKSPYNEIQTHPTSIVSSTLPPPNDPLPLPTMLLTTRSTCATIPRDFWLAALLEIDAGFEGIKNFVCLTTDKTIVDFELPVEF